MRNNHLFLVIIIMLFPDMFKSQEKSVSYDSLYKLFNSYAENDHRAMVFVNMYIQKARREENLKKLVSGYEEAIYYSATPEVKLLYADSAVSTSIKLRDNDLIARSYLGKGIIYYYNTRNYKKALEEYLMAFKYINNSKDEYLKNKIVYHLAIVKSYLGDHSEAAGYFVLTANFFENNMKRKGIHYNTRLNQECGYYNSIYRLSRCYYNLGLYEKEDSLLAIGLKNMRTIGEHPLEFAYFQKGKGIQFIRNKNYDSAADHLFIAENIFNDKEDFAALATINYYRGILNWNLGKKDESVKFFNKVDSLVNHFEFITPEIRPSYKYLISYSKAKGDSGRTDYYTQQLLKADSLLITDFPKLTSLIKYGYDGKIYEDEKQGHLDDKKNAKLQISFLLVSAVIVTTIIFYRSMVKEKKLQMQYRQLLVKMQKNKEQVYTMTPDNESFDVVEAVDGSNQELSIVRDDDVDDKLASLSDQSPTGNVKDDNREEDRDDITDDVADNAFDEDDSQHISRNKYDPQKINSIIEKLRVFEEEKKYLQKNLKMPDVADIVGTNRSILSHVVNVYLKIHYPDYIKILRIRYITELMLEDSTYLKYKIQVLADICGMSSRQMFSLHFRQVNGMNPTDFIRQRLKDLEDQ